MKRIVLVALSDLAHDQRMMRIASSLKAAGYDVLLVGKKVRDSLPLLDAPYRQKRISCIFSKGKIYYFEFNVKLFFFLLFQRMHCINAVDLDTIMAVYWISRIKSCKRVYDAHEFFTEQKEVLQRPSILRFWKRIELFSVPRFKFGYTVSASIAEAFAAQYGAKYEVIRNLPWLSVEPIVEPKEKVFIYQGSINEGRGLEYLLNAAPEIHAPVWLYGDGNFRQTLELLITQMGLENRMVMKGKLRPGELKKICPVFYAGLNLVEPFGLNQYYSLANKFFDYIQAGIPQVTMNFPEYAAVNREYEVAVLIDDLEPHTISEAMNKLLTDEVLYRRLKNNCVLARKNLNWESEEKKLLALYSQILK